ncbi:MAG: DNA-3-methyladenine glycosylase 2 family protein [Dehalococcoidia bacterium]|nr:DNA-3-methyladenine glycosylase 2 family protein [Dehalococcoidia bacterium]MSQ17843.1 DNA-3-methyladenine glycosylase 2 family protein [Dehalococcoidia bacterium]
MTNPAIIFRPTAPFDFNLTAGYLTYFRGQYGSDSLDDGAYRRLLDLQGKLVLATVRCLGTVDAPELAVELAGDSLTPAGGEAAALRVSWLLGADAPLNDFYALAQADPVMSGLTVQFRGLHLPHTASVFEALVLAVLGQQISTNVARVIRTLLIETYGPRQTIGGATYFAFPRPETLAAASVEELLRLKLSGRKAEYIQGIAQVAAERDAGLESLQELPDDAVVARLTALRGVGLWTAQWALVRALGRPDVFPAGDLALRRAVSRLYFGGATVEERQAEEFSRRWSPWRTYATLYLFTALRLGVAV